MAMGMCEVGDDAGVELLVEWFDQYFKTHPDSLAGCHIGLDASRQWVADHPEEMTGYDRPVDFTIARVPEPSWASEVWRADSSAFVEQIVRRLHERFSGRIVLYQVGSGACHENVPVLNPMSGYYRGGWYCSDFSQPMVRYFRSWLLRHYSGDVNAFRKAWSDPQVQFEDARVPDRLKRLQTEWFSFRSPLQSQTADYYHASSDAIDDCIILWAKAVKRASNGEALTASPVGSILDAGVNSNFIHQLLKNSLKRSLECSELDMLTVVAAQQSMPQITLFPGALCTPTALDEETMIVVQGLADTLDHCFEKSALPSELGGVTWAKPAAVIKIAGVQKSSLKSAAPVS
jgi:hypothetical protein